MAGNFAVGSASAGKISNDFCAAPFYSSGPSSGRGSGSTHSRNLLNYSASRIITVVMRKLAADTTVGM